MNSVSCFRCGKEIPANNLGRQDTCESCGADTRVCKNCKNFDTRANNMCREEQAMRVVEKEKSNFCEWFQVRAGAFAGSGNAPGKGDLKSAADALFGNKPAGSAEQVSSPTPADAAKAAAEALFKKK